LAVGVWRLGRDRGLPIGDGAEEPPLFAQIDPPLLKRQRVLIDEMARVFPDQLAWVAETQQRVWIGLESEAASPSSQPTLAVRVVVARRTQQGWTCVWSADVISQQEQVVRLARDAGSEAEFSVWTYLLPDGLVAVDSRLDYQGAAAFESHSSGVQRPGVPKAVGTLQPGEYQVFQTVVVMDSEVS
jgi:hypothetical protein